MVTVVRAELRLKSKGRIICMSIGIGQKRLSGMYTNKVFHTQHCSSALLVTFELLSMNK